MNFEWELDNPAIALEQYYEAVETFAKKENANELLEDEVSTRQSELNSKKSELNGLESRLASMGSYEKGDVDNIIQEVIDFSKKKIEGEERKKETEETQLHAKRDRDILENDNWLKNRLTQLLGDNTDVDRELTETEKIALKFEIERKQFLTASNERINEFEDSSTEEQLACQTVIGDLKGMQDTIFARFEPDIDKFKRQMEAIHQKYQPDIRLCQSIISEKIANRDEEIGLLQTERNREIQLANNEIDGYQREFKQTEKQFNEQIRMAKLQNKPTTRMENSKVSRLNAINDKIQKINNRVNKKISGVDQKIETAQSRHAKIIEKAESQLESVTRNRDQELSGPTRTYNGLVQDRDGQVTALQSQIDKRKNECHSKILQYKSKIEAERQAQSDNNTKIDQQIIDFVMSGDTCFDDVMDEQNAPFIALQGRIQSWMEMLSSIKKNEMSLYYQSEHEKQKSALIAKDYQELQAELSEATQYNDRLSVFAKNYMIFMVVGGALAALSALFVVFEIILKKSVGVVWVAIAALGITMVGLTVLKTKKEFSQICKYVSLASDYREFSCLTSQSTKITQDRELEKMKSMGSRLYDVHYGRAEAQMIHDVKEADIKEDYERNLKLLKKELENLRAQIERERDDEIKRIKDDSIERENNFNNEKDAIKEQIDSLILKIENLNSCIREFKDEIANNEEFMVAFENAYSILEKQLGNEKWIAPKEYTHGKLNDNLYIIPDNGEKDEWGHRKIYRVNHGKKAFVVNYDIADVEDSRVEEVNKIIHDLMFDLMYSVYRMNSKESYVQFVVDGMSATNDLKSTNVRNAFNIVEVVGKIEDIRGRIKGFTSQREKIAEKGITMDSINENNFISQDRPETYNLLYIIFKPDERRSKLDDDIRMLIPECEKYGFLPVFICEKDTWERENQEKDSIYKEIKGLANNEVLIFDGKTYSVAY